MNEIKFSVFGVLGAAVLTMGLISCDNDAEVSNEQQTELTTQGKSIGGDIAYQDFYLSRVVDDNVIMRFDPGPMFKNCLSISADCLPDLIIIVPRKVELYSQ